MYIGTFYKASFSCSIFCGTLCEIILVGGINAAEEQQRVVTVLMTSVKHRYSVCIIDCMMNSLQYTVDDADDDEMQLTRVALQLEERWRRRSPNLAEPALERGQGIELDKVGNAKTLQVYHRTLTLLIWISHILLRFETTAALSECSGKSRLCTPPL